jgi:hypothetical protein
VGEYMVRPDRGCHLCVNVRVWIEDVLGGSANGWMSKKVHW